MKTPLRKPQHPGNPMSAGTTKKAIPQSRGGNMSSAGTTKKAMPSTKGLKTSTGGSTRKVAIPGPKNPNTGGSTKKVAPKKPSHANTGGSTKKASIEMGKKDMKMDRTKGIREGSAPDKAIDLKDAQDYTYAKTKKTVIAKGIPTKKGSKSAA